MGGKMLKMVGLVLAVLLLLGVPRAAEGAVTCGQVASALGPCIPYVTGGGGPSPACCSGVKTLYGLTKASRPDRVTSCGCIKNQIGILGGKANNGAIGSLPGKCGVSLGYTPSTSLNCASIP